MSAITFRSQIAALPSVVGKIAVGVVLVSKLAALPVYTSFTDAVRLNTPFEATPVLWADGSGLLWADGSRMVF